MEQEWIDLLIENIQYQYRHAGYDRAMQVRKFAHSTSTGLGQEDEVTRYRRFEDDDLKKQRTRLYNPLTKYAISRPRKYWKKIGRVENINRSFTAKDETKLQELHDNFKQFQPGQALEDWLIQQLEFLGVTDPNAWIVYEREDERDPQGLTQSVRVYPFIFRSENCLNFSKTNAGFVNWFIGRTIQVESIYKDGTRRENILENYYLYAPGVAVSAREKGEKTVMQPGEVEIKITVYPPNTTGAVDRFFYISSVQNGTKEVPAMCAGTYMDEATGNNQVFVPWFDPAEHVIKDLIRDKSVSDVLTIVHAYPRRWEFDRECIFEGEEGRCEGGYINGNYSHICPSCKGTGVDANHTTEQASIRLVLPSDAQSQEKLLDLSKLAFTESVDIGLMQHVETRIEMAESRIMSAVFDSGLFQKPTNSQTRTATEVKSVLDGISDVLSPFCNTVSRHYELTYRVGAQYLEFELQVDHTFPEDLDIMTISDEVSLFDEVKSKGLGFEAEQAQRKRVLQKMFTGTPEQQKWIEAKYQHQPFAGKSETEISFILSARSPMDNDRVLWENFEVIFRDIFDADPVFYEKTYQAQKGVVAAKVEEYKQRVTLADVDPAGAPSFNDPDPNADPSGVNQ